MSAELDMSNNVANFAYLASDGIAWHGEGQAMPNDATLAEWGAAAGFSHKIQRAFVRYATGRNQLNEAELQTFDDRHVLFRSDTKAPLGLVSNSYKIVQPQQVVEMFGRYVDEMGFKMSTMGMLFGGRKYWALADIGVDTYVKDKADRIKGKLLCSTSADGSTATDYRFTTVRVVCANTLGFATAAKANVRVTHRTKIDAAKEDQINEDLGLRVDAARDGFASMIEDFRRLAGTAAQSRSIIEATAELVHPGFLKADANKKDKVLRSVPVNKIGELFMGKALGHGMDGTQGTVYGWLNAVTEYVDHHARADSVDNRFSGALWGKGNEVKQAARLMAIAMADGSTRYMEEMADTTVAPSAGSADFAALLAKR